MLSKISKICAGFSQLKTKDFFWNEVSQGVKTAEYAVRGIVPTTATLMKEEIENGTKSKKIFI